MSEPKLNDPGEEFLRSITWAEEDRHRFTSAPWDAGYRWFRAGNVVPLEQYRHGRTTPEGLE
jgi:hypothetical protein